MPSVCQTHPSALKLQRWMRTGHALEELAQLLPRWVTMYKALCEHRKEKIRSALEHGRSPSDRNKAEPPASMKCLIGRDQELWQREWGQCSECLENCGQGVWMPGVEKVESLLGEGAGAGWWHVLKARLRHVDSVHQVTGATAVVYADAHSTALVSDGWIKWLIHGYAKWMEVL